jgi:hypothetical protein
MAFVLQINEAEVAWMFSGSSDWPRRSVGPYSMEHGSQFT